MLQYLCELLIDSGVAFPWSESTELKQNRLFARCCRNWRSNTKMIAWCDAWVDRTEEDVLALWKLHGELLPKMQSNQRE